MKKIILALGIFCLAPKAFAQQDSIVNPLSISGYAELYYNYDFGKPSDHTRPNFLYSYNRHNEVNLNLGFVKAAYQQANVRANLALMAGTYAAANLAAEQSIMQHIFEANAGVRLSKSKDIWVDAGVFGSHIGFESAIGKDCPTLTRSLLAENSPYYESGAKITYVSDNKKLTLSGLYLNGWQRIRRPDGNNTPAFGHQLIYKPNDKITLNSSSFVGNDQPDSLRQMRYFHNFYGIFALHSKLNLITGFDIGWQQKSKGSSQYNNWYSPVAILQYNPTPKHSLAARAEYYADPNHVIVGYAPAQKFQVWSYSANFDYKFSSNIVWRSEARLFSAKNAIFQQDNSYKKSNVALTTALAVSF
ncbi:Putative beta-barrel porin-2, OmpL-like. bbp2 [Flexibacter flexilis DSM 6793]|uniref:Putative beta-barrel porin-2, OmpL-like. bbp2 n=1 Tax=Flexibacter flexilis DSM 6793 TaxID=927664 RepID=A0A1I1FNM0_9BACT|nr:porin [Flexibacter flexilis]SFB98693.1 Putative beta-barrel porin-2, OmpL-like. bbp2 [Flexibacter flexilis DSM 6793]